MIDLDSKGRPIRDYPERGRSENRLTREKSKHKKPNRPDNAIQTERHRGDEPGENDSDVLEAVRELTSLSR